MSRNWDGNDEWDEGRYAMWERSVTNAANGKRGQAFLRDLRTALLAIPDKRLVAGVPVDVEAGAVCAVGAYVAWKVNPAHPTAPDVLADVRRRVLLAADIDPGTYPEIDWGGDDFSVDLTDVVTDLGNVPRCLVTALQFENDVGFLLSAFEATPEEHRWHRMLQYVEALLAPDTKGRTA